MPQSYCQDVKDFHDKFGMLTPDRFLWIPQDLYEFRVVFFNEEFDEYVDAVDRRDLGTAIDSLIDLVYITCGCALLHGIKPDDFGILSERASNSSDYAALNLMQGQGLEEGDEGPHLLPGKEHSKLVRLLRKNIDDYILAYEIKSQPDVQDALAALYQNCLFASFLMGFTTLQWDELWADVQRANMAKKRAEKPEESKRGSTKYDIIKPEGWIPPRTAELVQKFINGEA